MILGFATNNVRTHEKTNFVDKILSGKKIHSLRKGKRWKAGMQIHMATGTRTKQYKQFNKGIDSLSKCVSTQTIRLITDAEYMNDYRIVVDGRNLSTEEQTELAHNDGFSCLADFRLWFNLPDLYPEQIIHWTDKRY